MEFKGKCLSDKLIVQRVEEGNMTKGGLYVPEVAKRKSTEATVVAVGSGQMLQDGTRIPIEAKIGDKVIVGLYCGIEIKIDGNDYLVIAESDIQAILK